MNPNKLDTSKVFENYVVGEIHQATGYAGIVTDVKVQKTMLMSTTYKIDDYSVTIKLLVNKDGELKDCKKVFKEVLTNGRTRSQTFITDFDLMGKDQILHLENLLVEICEVTFKIPKEINTLKIGEFEDEEAEEILTTDLIKAKKSDSFKVPECIKNYIIIPVIQPTDDFHAYAKYPAMITIIDCFSDYNRPDEVTVRITAYLFNGGKTMKYYKYFNCVNSKGKTEFDKFCISFDSVNDIGKVDITKIKGRLCNAEITGDKKMYISSILPDNSMDGPVSKIYNDIITISSNNEII